jgi:nucleoside 2-deoxyribosyltransferase
MSSNGESHKQINFPLINVSEIPSPSFLRLAAEMEGGLMYLASPYSSGGMTTPRTKKKRAAATVDLTMKLLDAGIWIFSPITYGLCFEARGHKRDNKWWMTRDFEFLKHSDVLGIHCLQDWEKSPGVQQEIDWALVLGKKIYLLVDDHDTPPEASQWSESNGRYEPYQSRFD